MTDTDQARAKFERIVQLQDDNERLQVQRNTLADALGQVLDENVILKSKLESIKLTADELHTLTTSDLHV
jgi:hypothetical protein